MKSGRMRTQMVLIAILSLIAGCTSGFARRHSDQPQNYADFAGASVTSFHSYGIDAWEPVDASRLVIWSDLRHAYLLTVWTNCQNLQLANRIGISSTNHTISTVETVKVGRQRCPISDIRPIDIERMKLARAQPTLGGTNNVPAELNK